jgi:hypothetical protein
VRGSSDHRRGPQGHRSGGADRTDRKLGIGVTFRQVRMDDVRVTHIDHRNLIACEVKRIVFVIVSARLAEGKQSGSFANAARSETSARVPLSAHVVGHAQYGCVCIDGIPIDTRRRLAEGAVSDKRHVQAAAQIGIFSHVRLLRGARDLNLDLETRSRMKITSELPMYCRLAICL